MAIDLYDAELQKEEELENVSGGSEALSEPLLSDQHWSLGSPLRKISAAQLEADNQGNPLFRNFERRLVAFLRETVGNEFHFSEAFQVLFR